MHEMASEEEKKIELEACYRSLQQASQQLRELQKAVEILDNQLIDISSLLQALQDIKEVESGREILVPISNGIFINARLAEHDSFLVNVGSGVVVRKSLGETSELLQGRFSEVDAQRSEMLKQFEKSSATAQELEKRLQTLLGKG